MPRETFPRCFSMLLETGYSGNQPGDSLLQNSPISKGTNKVGRMTEIAIKRVYEPQDDGDGYRVLVDRLWPRGMSKDRLHPDCWAKELAPSTEARKAFGHKKENFEEFRTRYLLELDSSAQAAASADDLLERPRVTLLYAAKDPQINHAVVLAEWLDGRQER